MKTPKAILIAAVLLTSVVLAACGSGSKGTPKAPGQTSLAFGQSKKVSSSLEITVTGVKEVSAKTLSRFPQIDRSDLPYFVYVKVTNIGKTDLGGTQIPLFLQDAHNVLQGYAPVRNPFPLCQSKPLPQHFGPNSTLSTCLIYVLGKGNSAVNVTYRPDATKFGISWSGAIAGQTATPSSKATH